MPRPRSGSQKLPPPLVPLSEVYPVLGISDKTFLPPRVVRHVHPLLVRKPASGKPGRTGRGPREHGRRQRGEPGEGGRVGVEEATGEVVKRRPSRTLYAPGEPCTHPPAHRLLLRSMPVACAFDVRGASRGGGGSWSCSTAFDPFDPRLTRGAIPTVHDHKGHTPALPPSLHRPAWPASSSAAGPVAGHRWRVWTSRLRTPHGLRSPPRPGAGCGVSTLC